MGFSKKIQLISTIDVYDLERDLPETDRALLKQAKRALDAAYAPYSNFYVGAAVLLDNGQVVIGNNQENASYPSGLCAERVAIYQAGARFPGIALKAIAIACRTDSYVIKEPLSPCGACRQALAEYENLYSKIRIIMKGETGKIYVAESIESLLPLMFTAKQVKKQANHL